MSQQAITQFWERLEGDAGMKAQLDKLLEGNQNVPADAIVAMGADQGLDFTVDELQTTLKLAADAELDDSELEAVSGGLKFDLKIEYTRTFKVEIEGISTTLRAPRDLGLITF